MREITSRAYSAAAAIFEVILMNDKLLRWEDAPDLLKPQEAAALLRIGKNLIYKLAADSNDFPKLMLGERNFLIPKHQLRSWIEKQVQAS